MYFNANNVHVWFKSYFCRACNTILNAFTVFFFFFFFLSILTFIIGKLVLNAFSISKDLRIKGNLMKKIFIVWYSFRYCICSICRVDPSPPPPLPPPSLKHTLSLALPIFLPKVLICRFKTVSYISLVVSGEVKHQFYTKNYSGLFLAIKDYLLMIFDGKRSEFGNLI